MSDITTTPTDTIDTPTAEISHEQYLTLAKTQEAENIAMLQGYRILEALENNAKQIADANAFIANLQEEAAKITQAKDEAQNAVNQARQQFQELFEATLVPLGFEPGESLNISSEEPHIVTRRTA